jgi:drug/metabolite transporter (DMT)-like permease
MLLLLFIGIAFFTLARMYNQNKFLYTIIGVGIALATQFIVGFVYAMVVRPTKTEIENSEILINVLAGLFSIIIVIVTYTLLKKRFQRKMDEEEKLINSFGAVEEKDIV